MTTQEELLERDDVKVAMAEARATPNVSKRLRVIETPAGIIIVKIGIAPCFLINAGSFVGVIACLALMREGELSNPLFGFADGKLYLTHDDLRMIISVPLKGEASIVQEQGSKEKKLFTAKA